MIDGQTSHRDGIRAADRCMSHWRGDHASLVLALATHLDVDNPQLTAEAAAVLNKCSRIAEPAREALAEVVAAQRAEYGPDVWAAADPLVRRAHQEAVMALTRLGDARALPSLLTSLDDDVDTWRAMAHAGRLPQCRAELVPRLIDHLARIDIAALTPATYWLVHPPLGALDHLADPSTVRPLLPMLEAAVRHEEWFVAANITDTLVPLGPVAAPAVTILRRIADDGNSVARWSAAAALWSIRGDVDEVLPLILRHMAERPLDFFSEVADILGQMGADAASTVPQLEALLRDPDEFIRVEAADALWRILGEPASAIVLDTLLRAWRQNQETSNSVTRTLERMGPAAAPALPDVVAELAETRRGGRFWDIESDEDLQASCRRLIDRLTTA